MNCNSKSILLGVLLLSLTGIIGFSYWMVLPPTLLTILGVTETIKLILQLTDWRVQDFAINTPANIVNAIVRLDTGLGSSATASNSAIEIPTRKKSECLMNVRKALKIVGFCGSVALSAILFCRTLNHLSHASRKVPANATIATAVVTTWYSKGMGQDPDNPKPSVNHSTRSGGLR